MATEISTLKVVVGTEDRQLATGLRRAESKIAAFSSRVGGLFKIGFGAGIGSTLTQLVGATVEKLRVAIIQQFTDTSRLSGSAARQVRTATAAMQGFGRAVFDAVQKFTVALSPAITKLFRDMTAGIGALKPFIGAFAADIGRAASLLVETGRYVFSFINLGGKASGSFDLVSKSVAFVLETLKQINIVLIDIGKSMLDVAIVAIKAVASFKTGKMSEEAIRVVRELNRVKLALQVTKNAASGFDPFARLEGIKGDQVATSVFGFFQDGITSALGKAVGAARGLRPMAAFGVSLGQQAIRGLGNAFKFLDKSIAARLESLRSIDSGFVGALEAGSMEAIQAEIALRDPLQEFKRREEQALLGETQKQTTILGTINTGIAAIGGALRVVGISG